MRSVSAARNVPSGCCSIEAAGPYGGRKRRQGGGSLDRAASVGRCRLRRVGEEATG